MMTNTFHNIDYWILFLSGKVIRIAESCILITGYHQCEGEKRAFLGKDLTAE